MPLPTTVATRALKAFVVDNHNNHNNHNDYSNIGAIFVASTTSSTNNEEGGSRTDDWVFPLLLSCLAGGSTCIGAAVVFCFSPQQIKHSMAFSLSLAASVMITVSIISIGPECWDGIIEQQQQQQQSDFETENLSTISVLGAATATVTTTSMVHWWLLFERIGAFGLGCGGYFLLSKLLGVLPEPDMLFLIGNDKGSGKNPKKEDDVALMMVRASSTTSSSAAPPPVFIDEEEDDETATEIATLVQRQYRNMNSSSNDADAVGTFSYDENDSNFDGGSSSATNVVVPSSEGGNSDTTPRSRNGHPQQQRQRRKPKNNSNGTTSTTATILYHGSGIPITTLERTASYDSTLSSSTAVELLLEDGGGGVGVNVSSDKDYDNTSSSTAKQRQRSWRVAMLLFVSLLCHNFPEGLCVVRFFGIIHIDFVLLL
jgi:zinc transporter ZupT